MAGFCLKDLELSKIVLKLQKTKNINKRKEGKKYDEQSKAKNGCLLRQRSQALRSLVEVFTKLLLLCGELRDSFLQIGKLFFLVVSNEMGIGEHNLLLLQGPVLLFELLQKRQTRCICMVESRGTINGGKGPLAGPGSSRSAR